MYKGDVGKKKRTPLLIDLKQSKICKISFWKFRADCESIDNVIVCDLSNLIMHKAFLN